MQWRDRTLQTLRQARLTVTWGVQMVLYPVYLLFQSGRLVGQHIRAAVNRFLPLLEAVKDDDFDPAVGVPPLNPDAPLQNVLDFLVTFDLPIIISPRAWPKAKKPESLPGRKSPSALIGKNRGAIAQSLPISQPAPLSIATPVNPLAAELEKPGTLIRMGTREIAHQTASGDRLQPTEHPLTINGIAIHEAEEHPIYLAQTIRGFASLLATRNLVLVDTQNQILDILTYEQQVQLYQRIVYEVAGYYRSQNLRLRAQGHSLREHWQRLGAGEAHRDIVGRGTWRFLPPPQKKETMAPPVRLFRRVMEWMQTSPIAVSANVFQESALVQVDTGLEIPSPMAEGMPKRAIAPGQDIQIRRPFWQGLMQALGLSNTRAAQAGTSSAMPPTAPSHSNAPWFDPDHHGDLDGWLSANQFTQLRQQAEKFLSMPSLPFRNRWISNWDEPIQGSDSIVESPIKPTEANGHEMKGTLVPSQRGPLSQTHPAANTHGSIAKAPITQAQARHTTPRSTTLGHGVLSTTVSMGEESMTEDTLLSPTSHGREDDGRSDLVSSIDPANREGALSSTLVDTKATLVGYVKHPLEQVLEWIDLGMLWIEDLAAKAWGWVKRVLKSD